MKWGVRRYQNADGTLTEAGKKRLGYSGTKYKEENLYKARQQADEDVRNANKYAAITGIGGPAIGAAIGVGYVALASALGSSVAVIPVGLIATYAGGGILLAGISEGMARSQKRNLKKTIKAGDDAIDKFMASENSNLDYKSLISTGENYVPEFVEIPR